MFKISAGFLSQGRILDVAAFQIDRGIVVIVRMWSMRLSFLFLSLFLLSCQHWKVPSKAGFSAGAVYKVKKGDNIHQIASAQHISVFDLIESNGITDTKKDLYVGRRLYIPEPLPHLQPTGGIALHRNEA